jgi:SulP family sulfate permease
LNWNTELRRALSGLDPTEVWKSEFRGYSGQTFGRDLLAGVTVGVVALPLALAFGETSGAGAASGLFTAIVAGFLAALFGGSRLNVSGPTGAMTVVLLPIIAKYGLQAVFVVGMMAGAMLITMGLLRLGRLIQLIPWPVVTGFTAGIAVIIFLQQVPNALGVSVPSSPHGAIFTTWEAIKKSLEQPNIFPPLFAALTAGIMLAWPRKARVPGSIIALLVVTLLSLLPQWISSLAGWDLALARIGQIPNALPVPQLPGFALADLSSLFSAALAVAVLGGLESLLSSVVADGMSGSAGARGRFDPDRELIGQGIANLFAPLVGGVPATGAIARTAVNVRSGAQTRLSAIIHAGFLLLVVLFLGSTAGVIPKSVLAGILMVTASRMIELDAVRALARSTKSDFATMLATFGVTVAFDLILAIEVGLVIAGVLFIQRMRQNLALEAVELEPDTPKHLEQQQALLREHVLAYRVEGPLFFAVASEVIETVTRQHGMDALILRLEGVPIIDASGVNALHTIMETLERRGVKLLVAGMQPRVRALLMKMGLLEAITMHGKHDFKTFEDAIGHAWSHVVRNGHAPPSAPMNAT